MKVLTGSVCALLFLLSIFSVFSIADARAEEQADVDPLDHWPDDPARVAKMEPDELLAQRWFEIELIIFERLRVLDANTGESLVQQQQRRWPENLSQLRDATHELRLATLTAVEEGAAYSDELDLLLADDVWCYGFPLLPFEDPIHPSRQPVENIFGDEFSVDQAAIDTDGASAVEDEEMLPGEETDTLDDTAAETDLAGGFEVEIEPEPPTDLELLKQAVQKFELSLQQGSYTPLPDLQMISQAKALNRRQHLRPLLHTRWRQPVPERRAPQPVYLAVEPSAQLPGLYLSPTELPQPMLEGWVALTLGRYLHVNTQLWYQADTLGLTPQGFPVAVPPQPATGGYMELRQSRRMRSEELHYLDHPKLGMLIVVTPVAIPETLTNQQQALVESSN